MQNFAIEFFDLQVAGNVGAQGAERVRKRRSAKTGMKFLGDGAAADHFAAFENERLESALGEIKRGDECIVAAADENYALSDGHGQLFSLAERGRWRGGFRRRLRTARARAATLPFSIP